MGSRLMIDSPSNSEVEEEEVQGFPMAAVEEFGGIETGKLKLQSKKQKQLRKKAKSGGFESLGLSSPVFRAIKRKGYQVPTPIQRKTLPLVLAGYDVVAMARTGSGKTAAFLVPMLERLKAHASKAGARAVILSPTRELALQTFKFCKELGRYTDLRSAVLVGGDSMEAQFEELAKNPDIIIATPGRLMHHLSEVDGMSLRTVEYVVFDEADRLFEMGFAEQLRQILSHLSETRQTLLFSATMPRLLADFAKAGLRDPHIVRLDLDTKISPDLLLSFFTLRHDEKPAALVYLIREQIRPEQQTLIFVATKHHVEFLHELLRKEGIEISVVYGAMDQAARKIHLAKFRARKTMLLLVTDVAARGIDIPLLDNVVNYDFPFKPKLFVHRVGRAARAGRTGTAYSFVTSEEMPYLLDLHLFLSRPLWPSPNEEELASDREKVLAKMNEASEKGDSVYGRLPQSLLDYGVEKFRELVHQSTELMALQKSSANAFHLYCKTRPSPSLESVRRVKRLPSEGMHPLFRSQVGSMEAAAAAFTETLKKFRPKQTVLEAESEAARSKNKQTPVAQAVEVMKRKRAMHEPIISATQHQKASMKSSVEDNPELDHSSENNSEVHQAKRRKKKEIADSKRLPRSYKDEEYYINAIPSNRHAEIGLAVNSSERFASSQMDAEVLDLLPDDQEGVQKQKAVYHWDKKNRKFIKLHRGEKISSSGKIKTESGTKVNVGNRGIYKKWKERTHMRVSTYGEEEDVGAGTNRNETHVETNRRGRSRQGKGGKSSSVPNANVRNELRGIEEVRKKRQQKVLRQSMKSGKGAKKGKGNSKKGDKSGKGKNR